MNNKNLNPTRVKEQCECGHTFIDHDYKVKEGFIASGSCDIINCQCSEFSTNKTVKQILKDT